LICWRRYGSPGRPISSRRLNGRGLAGAGRSRAGHGRAVACVAAALWPGRCAGLVSVNEGGYLIYDVAAAGHPLPPALEAPQEAPQAFATAVLDLARPGPAR
jgi:hypothetical protein